MGFPYIILFLHYFLQGPGVGGTKFTIVNNCSQIIWPVFLGAPTLGSAGLELPPGNSVAVKTPSSGWSGHMWGRTGCNFNASGYGSCATGDCGSGQMECKTDGSAATLLKFTVAMVMQSTNSYTLEYPVVSLTNGFNLPLLINPNDIGCRSSGCSEDLYQICPPELRTKGGRACRGACEAFNTTDYCCTGTGTESACKPTNYSRLFKTVCSDAETYPGDAYFRCSSRNDYVITFCPTSLAQIGKGMPPAYSPPPTTNGMPPVQSPGYSPKSSSDNPRRRNGKNHYKLIIIVTAVSIACVIIVSSIVLLCILNKRQSTSVANKERRKQNIENFLLQNRFVAPERYKNHEIKKMTKSFRDKLGKGGYGSVYKGVLPDGSLVAVKVLIETDSNGEEFINEVASISRTSHVNVVTLLGFCNEGEMRALVYEYMPNKSLDKFLSSDGSADNTHCSLDLEKLYKIAVGIARGLEYLHSGCSTRIVHFDIKPQNILLDEDFCPKISDFGLAKLCKKKQSVLSVLGLRGTVGYMAPEVFSRNYGGVSYKSDVYSYGMMVLGMAGADRMVEANPVQSSENYFPDKIYEHVIHGVTRILHDHVIEGAEEISKKMFLVGFWCIQTTPSDRPPMSKILEMLEGSIESIQIPPKPVLFTPTLPQQDFEFSSSFSAYTENIII